jgi:1-acyl-sn-glycerol-3-phosphate acyltransferase
MQPLLYQPSTPITTTATVRVAGRSFQLVKLARLAAEFIRGGFLLRLQFPQLQQDERLSAIQHWASRILHILEVKVECNQLAPANFAGLVVANHLSWLDVLVIQSLMPGVFVAKSEVRRWPLIGAMAQACKTIFVDRASARSAHAMVDSTVAAFEQGYTVVAFPEGTSSDGAEVGSFHANIFEGAIRARTDVQPLTLRYVDTATGMPAVAAVFTGEMTLLSSLRRVLGTSTIRTQVHFGNLIAAQGHSRKSLAQQAHRSIQSRLPASSRKGEEALMSQQGGAQLRQRSAHRDAARFDGAAARAKICA